jgi:hypothetical protein
MLLFERRETPLAPVQGVTPCTGARGVPPPALPPPILISSILISSSLINRYRVPPQLRRPCLKCFQVSPSSGNAARSRSVVNQVTGGCSIGSQVSLEGQIRIQTTQMGKVPPWPIRMAWRSENPPWEAGDGQGNGGTATGWTARTVGSACRGATRRSCSRLWWAVAVGQALRRSPYSCRHP